MASGDPFYCFEHKCWQMACSQLKHAWETDEEYETRTSILSSIPHNCPTCRCVGYESHLPLPYNWRM